MPSNNDYMRDYMRNRWTKRRAQAVELLGGKCVKCGLTDSLQFDHIDPLTKVQTIARMSSASEKRFWEEIGKCQLLCGDCHNVKTLKDLGRVSTLGTHGTVSSYKICKCELCREAKAAYMKEYMKTHSKK